MLVTSPLTSPQCRARGRLVPEPRPHWQGTIAPDALERTLLMALDYNDGM